MNTLGKRIAIAREKLGLNQSELARHLDVTPQAVQKWEADGSKPRDKAIDLMTSKLGVTKQWLLLGNADLYEEQTAPIKGHRIPIVGMAQLGDGGHWLAYDHPDSYVQWYSDDPNAYAVQGIGDSMQPRIKHKEFVIIEPSHPIMNGDEVFVVTVDGRRMVKIYSYTKDDRVHLESENKEHEKIILDKSEMLFMHYVAGIAKSSKMYV